MTEADGNLRATPAAIPKKTLAATTERIPRRHPEKSSATPKNRHHPPKNLRDPEKIAKNHENMAKRAKNVLLAISSGGGYFYIFVAMVKS